MNNTERFAKAQSPLAKKSKRVRAVLHIISIPFTALGLAESYGLSLKVAGLSMFWVAAVAVTVALMVQYAIASQESSVARQAVWGAFPNIGAASVWGASFALLCGLVWFNHQTSQVGRIEGVNDLIGDAQLVGTGDIDSARSAERLLAWSDFRADSLNIEQALALELKANAGTERGAMVPVASMRKKAKSVSGSHPSWSAGIYQNANKVESAAKSSRQMADAKARKAASKELQDARKYAKSLVASGDSVYSSALSVRTWEDGRRKESHDSVKAIAQSGGFWLVILSSCGSFLICLLWEAYRRISGLEMEGEIYDPRTGKSELMENLNGFVGDVIDGVNIRIKQNRESYQAEIKTRGGYAFPRSAVLIRTVCVLGISYIAYSNLAPTTDQEVAMSGMSGAETGFLISMVMALVATVWQDKWNPKAELPEPVLTDVSDSLGELYGTVSIVVDKSDSPKTTDEVVAHSPDKSPETVVRQEIQPVDKDDDSTVEIMTPDEIRKSKDRCRKYYERQFTSATKTGQASNTDKYRKERTRLRQCGYKVSAKGPIEKRNVKVEGKPETVAFKRLIISE